MEALQDIYQKVLKKFPKIKEKEIEVKPVSELNYISIEMIDSQKYHSTNEIVRKPTIYVGTLFFFLRPKEKEAIIAHELGHYMHNRRFSNDGLRRVMNRLSTIKKGYANERLTKWGTLVEINADNHAANAGYGELLLDSLKNLFKNDYDYFTEKGKEETSARIENLEKILENTS